MKFSLMNRQVDGGYGMVIVVSTFLIRLIVDGIAFSYGNLLLELLDEFDQDRASTAVIGSVLHGTLAITGPLVAVMCEKYGYRAVVVLGATISCIGFVISTFVTSMVYLYLSYGLVGGLGFGMMYLPASACVVQYFEKHRALATGISLCGSGIGTFVFNNLTRFLIDNYGWRGTILLEGAFSLQCAVFGLLLLPPIQPKTPAEVEVYDNPLCTSQKESCANTYAGTELGSHPVVTSFIDIDERVNKKGSDEGEIEDGSEEEKIEDGSDEGKIKDGSEDGKIKDGSEEGKINDGSEGKIMDCSEKGNIEDNISCSKVAVVNINEQPNQKERSRMMCNPFRDNQLLKDPRFIVILLSTFIVFLAFPVPFNFTADLAVESGMTKYEGSLLTSAMGIANTVGRVLIGWFADLPCMNQMVLTVVLLLLTGASTFSSPFLTQFHTRMIYNCIFGFFIGGYYTLLNVICVDIFGTELIVKALGMILFTAGFGLVIASPLGGLFYDITGNYDVTFVVAASEFLVGGILILLIIMCKQKRESTHL